MLNLHFWACLQENVNENPKNSDWEEWEEGQKNKVEGQTGRVVERQQYLEARHNIMMLMRIKQLVTCSP